MQIAQVDLDNVKSYRRASIPFTDGINAICGPNGAGKSTLLESIGFALFDVLPFSQSQFVREGEKTATVTVHVVDKDGRAYQVVRRCGSSSQHYVYDPEIDQRLTTKKAETVDWLKDFLGVEESSDLSVLFKDAVGVPQGLLTAAFLLTPANRKGTFDPLLRVDEYGRVWDALLEPRRQLVSDIAAEEKQIAGFEAELKDLPGWQAKAAELLDKVQADEKQQKSTRAELDDVAERKEDMEAVKKILDDLLESVTHAESSVKTRSVQLNSAQNALDEAKTAQAVVDETQAGYQAYLTAQASLETLEDQRSERDRLKEAHKEKTTEQALAKQRVDGLEAGLEAIESAEDKMEALRPDVETQERLEGQLRSAQRDAERLVDEKRDLTDSQQQLADLEAKLVKLLLDLEERASVETRFESLRGELEVLDSQWEDLLTRITEHDVKLGELQEQDTVITGRVANATASLEREQAQLERLKDRLSQVRTGLAELADVEQQSKTLRRELAELDVQEEELTVQAAAHQAELDQVRAQTDLLEAAETAQCPVCDGPLTTEHRADLLARNAERHSHLMAAWQATRSKHGQVAGTRKRKQIVLEELGRRAKELPRLGEEGEVDTQVEAQEEAVSRALGLLDSEQAAALTNRRLREDAEALLAKLRVQSDEVHKLRDQKRQDVEDLEARLKDLPRPAEEEELLVRIKTQQERVEELESLVDILAGAPAEVERLKAELGALGDPRRDFQRAADVAGRRGAVEEELAETRARLSELNDRIAEIERDLTAYLDLDDQLEAERRALEAHGSDHQRYLAHIREAEMLPERQSKVEALAAELAGAQAELEELVRRRDEEAKGYNAEIYAELSESFQALRDKLATLVERLRQQRAQLKEARDKISELTSVQGRLDAARAQHGELNETLTLLAFIRQVLRAAGPKITKALVEVISLQAARLYADIMADHTARLHWSEDYEIQLTTGGRERCFQQLSGGEQMASALAVRLALLREVSDIDVAFFDEPTANLDDQRRDNLAEQILNVKGFSQLFVISHDDTFERDTDHVIRVLKKSGVSQVEA